MQTLQETGKKHLSHDAALMLLAVLPEHIRNAYDVSLANSQKVLEIVMPLQ